MRTVITGAASNIGMPVADELSDTHEVCLRLLARPGRASMTANLMSYPNHGTKAWVITGLLRDAGGGKHFQERKSLFTLWKNHTLTRAGNESPLTTLRRPGMFCRLPQSSGSGELLRQFWLGGEITGNSIGARML